MAEVTKDHVVPIAGAFTLVAGDTLYYADNAQVSATNNQGSLTAGQSYGSPRQTYVISASLSTVSVVSAPAATVADPTRSSDCSTMSRLIGIDSTALSTGNAYGVLAISQSSNTYTKIRFATAGAPSAITALRAAVWDSSGNPIASTADISATITTGPTLFDNLALATGAALTAGQSVYLGVAWVGTTLTVAGVSSLAAANNALPPVLVRSATGYAGGAVPVLNAAGATTRLIWAELVP